jgi:hypothetical protein
MRTDRGTIILGYSIRPNFLRFIRLFYLLQQIRLLLCVSVFTALLNPGLILLGRYEFELNLVSLFFAPLLSHQPLNDVPSSASPCTIVCSFPISISTSPSSRFCPAFALNSSTFLLTISLYLPTQPPKNVLATHNVAGPTMRNIKLIIQMFNGTENCTVAQKLCSQSICTIVPPNIGPMVLVLASPSCSGKECNL